MDFRVKSNFKETPEMNVEVENDEYMQYGVNGVDFKLLNFNRQRTTFHGIGFRIRKQKKMVQNW